MADPIEAAGEWLERNAATLRLLALLPKAAKQQVLVDLDAFARAHRREGTEARDREYADALGIPAARDTMSPSLCASYVKEATALAEHEGRIAGAREMRERAAYLVATHDVVWSYGQSRFSRIEPQNRSILQRLRAKAILALPDEPERI